eukprot:3363195-Pyramimonas_sp.AAC.1
MSRPGGRTSVPSSPLAAPPNLWGVTDPPGLPRAASKLPTTGHAGRTDEQECLKRPRTRPRAPQEGP